MTTSPLKFGHTIIAGVNKIPLFAIEAIASHALSCRLTDYATRLSSAIPQRIQFFG